MEQYYLVLLAFLGVIAVIDLFVGGLHPPGPNE